MSEASRPAPARAPRRPLDDVETQSVEPDEYSHVEALVTLKYNNVNDNLRKVVSSAGRPMYNIIILFIIL
jgi:hypothetical protein